MSSSPQPGRPVIFGEVLFDVFPDGASVLGGAAFNVAWSLCGLGLDPLFVSRVGDDEHGRSVLDAMRRWQMDTSAVQIDPDHPTGVVSVAFSDGEPSYDIVSDRAYDHIDREAASESVRRIEPVLLYHGTLALRSAASRAALVGLRQVVRGPIFLDVNLRFPWWTLEDVERLLRAADHAKLNVHELAVLGRKLGVPEDASLEDRSRRLLDVCDLDQLIITRGAEGAILVARGGAVLGAEPPPGGPIVDTVGAGDAFSAVMIYGFLREWPDSLRLARAVDFAARVCSIRGATSDDREVYRATADDTGA